MNLGSLTNSHQSSVELNASSSTTTGCSTNKNDITYAGGMKIISFKLSLAI